MTDYAPGTRVRLLKPLASPWAVLDPGTRGTIMEPTEATEEFKWRDNEFALHFDGGPEDDWFYVTPEDDGELFEVVTDE